MATPSLTGRDGTLGNPFNGSALELFLEIEDNTPSSYTWGGWQIAPAGSFCSGGYQFFSTENRLFGLSHPRVRSGVASLRVIGFFREAGFELTNVESTFYVEAHPLGCPGEGGGGGDSPSDLLLQTFPSSASFGQTVTLTASAQSQSNSLTFLFYVSTIQSSGKGSLIGTRTGSGCQNGCSASTTFQAADFPTTHFFMFEAQDSSGTAASDKRAVQVSANGGGGSQPPPPDDPEDSPTVCQPCGGTVDAGPVSTFMVGGGSLSLFGNLQPPSGSGGSVVAGTLRWLILDDAGLGNDLQLLNSLSANATLRAPQVAQDTNVRIGFEGTFGSSGCGCIDEMEVTILAEAPPAADLALTKSAPAASKDGQNLTYTLQVKNEGPQRASNVSLIDPLPDGLTYLSSSASQGSCQFNNRVLTCSLNSLNRGAQATVSLETRLNGSGTLVNNASVNAEEPDPRLNNNDAQAVTVVSPSAVNLVLSKRATSAQPRVGEELHYELTVSNDSQTEATGVVLEDPLPQQLVYLGASATQGSCFLQSPSALMTCNLGTLPAGAQVTVQLRTRAKESGEIINSASVESIEDDSRQEDNQATSLALVEKGLADLEVTLASSTTSLDEGAALSYTLQVNNQGPRDAEGVTLTTRFPESFTSAAALPSQGSCDVSGEQVLCHLGMLEIGQQVSVEITGLASAEGEMVHSIEVESESDDPDPENNLAHLEVLVKAVQFIMVPHSLGLASTFVSLGVVNLADGPNTIEIQGLDRNGSLLTAQELPSPASNGQSAFLTTEVIDQAETLVARGLEGPIRTFFMLGSNQLQELDGIGGVMQSSEVSHFAMMRRGDNQDTIIFFFNPVSEEGCEVELQLFNAAGEELASATLSLAPMGSFRGGLEEIFGNITVDEGYLTANSSLEVRGFALAIDGRNFAALTGKSGLQTRRLLAPHFVAFPDATTVLRLLNLADDEATGTVRLLNDQGQLLAEADISVPGRQLGVFDLKNLFDFETLGVNTGYLELLLSGGTAGVFERSAFVVASVSYQSPSFEAALPLSGSGYEETLFLHVAQSSELKMFHGMAILNAGDTDASGRVEVYDEGGSLTGEASFSLKPGERMVDLLNGPALFGPGFSQIKGHIRVISDQPVIAFTLFGGESFLAAIEGQSLDE